MTSVRVKVIDGWAVFDGARQRGGGELVEVDTDTADEWLRNGWVEPTKVTPRTK